MGIEWPESAIRPGLHRGQGWGESFRMVIRPSLTVWALGWIE